MSVDSERKLQNKVKHWLIDDLGYAFLGSLEDTHNLPVIEELLKKNLEKRGYSKERIARAVSELTTRAANQTDSLYQVNKSVYALLRYGLQGVKDNAGQRATVHYIDWTDFSKNDFYVAEEVSVLRYDGVTTKRPDIVLYVNGIALGMFELKRSCVSVGEGIRQMLTNQKKENIQNFFATEQLLFAGNEAQGLRYGTTETPEKYYLIWKEDAKATDKLSGDIRALQEKEPNQLRDAIISLCQPERFLSFIHDFVIFDAGIKKVARHNQYFANIAARARIKAKEGGIIWNTQGSGKSLIMVWLAKWIIENINDSRVVIITDRDELDDQIESLFFDVEEKVTRAKSCADLRDILNKNEASIVCSLIHKYGHNAGKQADIDQYVKELLANLPRDYKAKGNIVAFVDECHRTNSGKLHTAARTLMPDAVLIGFTGTPLLKKDKTSSIATFGSYIHTYKFDEGVADGVVLDLRYEARDVDQDLSSKDKVDLWFESKTAGLTDRAKLQLKQSWTSINKLYSAKQRLEKIASDIIFDMSLKPRLKNDRGTAMLVADSIYEACRYWDIFQSLGFTKCAVVTSYEPSTASVRTATSDLSTQSEEEYKKAIYERMLGGKSVAEYEADAKKQFKEEPGKLKLLIVVDKLLTGFDAPSATYLYIDKSMRDHDLFQAICRVNRPDGEDKDYGYIVDYMDLFRNVQSAISDYTSGAFDEYDTEDIEGLIKGSYDEAKAEMDGSRTSLEALFENVNPPRNDSDFIDYFCNDGEEQETAARRDSLYSLTAALSRSFATCCDRLVSHYGYEDAQVEELRSKISGFNKVKEMIRLASCDYMDESSLVEYIGLLTQIQSLLDSGLTEEEIQSKFPEIDFSTALDQIAAIQSFLKGRETLLPGLSSMFGEALPDEMVTMTTDLDMTGAQARWDEFAANPGVITTDAIIASYTDAEDVVKPEVVVDAFISSYTEIPEGADKSQLTPEGLIAYVEKYAEVTTGADVSGLTPEIATAFVAGYQELATGADVSQLKPDEIVAYVSSYAEKEGVDISALNPDAITAFVMAYEEVTGGALTTALTPTDIAAIVTEYLVSSNVDMSKITDAQVDAVVSAYAEATDCDKSALKAEVQAQITAYVDAENVQKPSFIKAQVSITGYDLTAYKQFIAANPVTVSGIVRLGEVYTDPTEALNAENVTFWQDGVEIPATMVPTEMLTPDKVAVLDEDGTMHILLSTELTGDKEVIEDLRTDIAEVDSLGLTALGKAAGLLPVTIMGRVQSAVDRLKSYEKTKDYNWIEKFWATICGESTDKGVLNQSMLLDFDPTTLATISTYVSEAVTAIQNGDEIAQEDYDNLQKIVEFLNGLELAGVGENVTAGIGEAMAAAGWETDAESVAINLENALKAALVIQSPSQRMHPVGENVAAGVGEGAAGYDFSADGSTIATAIETAITAAITANPLSAAGTAAMTGLASGMTEYGWSATAGTVSSGIRTAASTAISAATLRSVGVNAMSGLAAGIRAGQSGVVSAMRSAAQSAVTAAKNALKIKSPSRVFRDEIGVMTMKGFGQGVLAESKAQAKVIRNAARYLTGETKEGAIIGGNTTNNRTYDQSSSITLTGNTFSIRDEQDIYALAAEIATLTKRQQRGKGLRISQPATEYEAEDEDVREVQNWIAEQGFTPGTPNHELLSADGSANTIIDLAWPDGIQVGLSQPLALLTNPDAETQAAVSKAGYKFFVNVAEFKKYVMNLYGLQ